MALSGSNSTRERGTLTAGLTRRILALIQEDNLGPGDRLPPARVLADRFDVATPTLREALQHLQAMGVLDIRHGSGTYVRQPRERLMLANPAARVVELHVALQVLDARLLIEPHLVELAAGRITDVELAVVEECIARGAAALAGPAADYLRANNDLHVAIARASGNVVLAEIVESLIELHAHELHVVDPVGAFGDRQSRDHPDHLRIFAALHARDPVLAGAMMRAHLAAARAGVDARLDRGQGEPGADEDGPR